MSNNPIDPMMFGEMFANVKNTADDVKAMRVEVGEIAKQTAANTLMLAEHDKKLDALTGWKHNIADEVQKLIAWQHALSGERKQQVKQFEEALEDIANLKGHQQDSAGERKGVFGTLKFIQVAVPVLMLVVGLMVGWTMHKPAQPAQPAAQTQTR